MLSRHQFITQHESQRCLTTAALQHGTLHYIELRTSVKLGNGTLRHPNILDIASLIFNSSGYTQRGYIKRFVWSGGSIPDMIKHPPSYTCCNNNFVFTNHQVPFQSAQCKIDSHTCESLKISSPTITPLKQMLWYV